jgi:hypothetical protein
VSWFCYLILIIALILWFYIWRLRAWMKAMKKWADDIRVYIRDDCSCVGPDPGDPPPPPGGWPT